MLNIIENILTKRKKTVEIDIKSDINFGKVYELCKPYSMTSTERMYALFKAMEYVINNKIEGAVVECGVWRGGSSMLCASIMKTINITKDLYLYDTFEGMPAPSDYDKSLLGENAKDTWDNKDKCFADIQDVQNNIKSTGYDTSKVYFIKGLVEKTIPTTMPKSISLLRLDTDGYESTNHELKYLFPLVAKGGVVIIDDYGHWLGVKKAVDEYFAEQGIFPLLNRIDYTGRILIKV